MKPDWNSAPAFARFVAKDFDGTWHWFSARPEPDEEDQRWHPKHNNRMLPAVMHPPYLQPISGTKEGYRWYAVNAAGGELFTVATPSYDWLHHEWGISGTARQRFAMGDHKDWMDSLEEWTGGDRGTASRDVERQAISGAKYRKFTYKVVAHE